MKKSDPGQRATPVYSNQLHRFVLEGLRDPAVTEAAMREIYKRLANHSRSGITNVRTLPYSVAQEVMAEMRNDPRWRAAIDAAPVPSADDCLPRETHVIELVDRDQKLAKKSIFKQEIMLRLLGDGLAYKLIARSMGMSHITVKIYLNFARKRLLSLSQAAPPPPGNDGIVACTHTPSAEETAPCKAKTGSDPSSSR